MSKKTVDEYTCDLCGDAVKVPGGRYPTDWVKVEYEPTDRTFVEKHVCGACVSKIKYPPEKKA